MKFGILILGLCFILVGCSVKGTLVYQEDGRLKEFKVSRGALVKSNDVEIDSRSESILKDFININGGKYGK